MKINYEFKENSTFVEILGDEDKSYKILFFNDNDQIIFSIIIKENNWASSNMPAIKIVIYDEDDNIIKILQDYYGQFNPPTDKVISQYFDGDYIGGCIEVGSHDGIIHSNTKYFENKGWYNLSIEPNPLPYEKLKMNRKNTLNYAISSENKNNISFYVSHTHDELSSLIDQFKENERDQIKIDVRTLDYCIENYYKYDKIDFISIDTEGTELDVLKGFDINKWQPKLMIIENNDNDNNIIEEYLRDFDYIKDKRYEVNDFYIKKTKI